MRIAVFGAICGLAWLALATGCRADPFCTDLATLTGAAGGGFKALKGRPDDFMPDTYAGKVTLAGADDCTIDTFKEAGDTEYVCFWPHWPKKDEAWITATYKQVAEQVDACLSGARKTAEPDRIVRRKPGAWTVTVTHRKLDAKAIGKLRLIVGKG